MIYADKVKTNREVFIAKVRAISQRLGIEPEWMMQVFMQESSMNHQAVNPISGATGLIQFMPNTAISLGTTVAALKTMTNVQQLDWVEKYFRPYTGRMNCYVDVYFTVFFPLAVGKPDDWVLQTSTQSAALIARQNSIYDLNKDGKLTVAEVREAILRKVPAEWRAFFIKKKQKLQSEPEQSFSSQPPTQHGDGLEIPETVFNQENETEEPKTIVGVAQKLIEKIKNPKTKKSKK